MEYLFSYGTLQDEKVQEETFGRILLGQQEVLVGYKLSMLAIKDENVIATSGKTMHPIIELTNNLGDTIAGLGLEITKEELEQADEYEVEEYKRVLVELKSGRKAWVYVSNL